MPNENAGEGRTQPVRITHMTIAPGDPRGLEEGPLVIRATLDPAPDREELQWWMEQLRDRVKVRSWSIYGGATEISERHRHRYEVNTAYKDRLEQHGLRFSGLSPDGVLPEIVEYEDHPWFIGVQFHPELKSRPFEPHPLFASFVQAAMVQSRLV